MPKSRKRVKKNLRRTKRNYKKQGGMRRLGNLKVARPMSPVTYALPARSGEVYPLAEATGIPVMANATRDDADLDQQLDEIYQDLNNPLKVTEMIIRNELSEKLSEIFKRYPKFDVKKIYNPDPEFGPEYANKSLLDYAILNYAIHIGKLELVNQIIDHKSVTPEFLEDTIDKLNREPNISMRDKNKITAVLNEKISAIRKLQSKK